MSDEWPTLRRKGRARRVNPVTRVILIGGAGFALVLIALVASLQIRTSMALSNLWLVSGQPCSRISRAGALASGYHLSHTFAFDDIRFSRAFGFVSCMRVHDHGGLGLGETPVCQFNNPSIVEIASGPIDAYFATQDHPATVSITDGAARCVLNATVGLHFQN